MIFDFLEAADGTPLTKTFTKSNDSIQTQPYPFVRNFNSHRVDVSSLQDLYHHLVHHADMGHCLLKGQLDRELMNESRAAHTVASDLTSWVLLDLDFDDGWYDIDEFLAHMNPDWIGASYIWQDSSSAGVLYEPGLRGHLFLMLSKPISPSILKAWLKERNLTDPRLNDRLKLTATGMSLRWPLDITTCQNDKLIYIAPPTLEGLEDPIETRIRYCHGPKGAVPPPTPVHELAVIEQMIAEKVAVLREGAGLPRRVPKLMPNGNVPLLQNPEECAVTGVRRARDFVYLNLNGGDSWGYYFPADKPDIVFNFKDEPAVRLRDIAPNFYYEYRREMNRQAFGEIEAYVFREAETDTYYNALYRQGDSSMMLLAPVRSKDRLKDFMNQYGYAMPDTIEDWTVAFDPTTTSIIDRQKRWVNKYRPTEYLLRAPDLTAYPEVPPVIDKLLCSICAHDEKTREHFLNWLACLVQSRERLETAWIFHGVQGTGKGLFLSRVLIPILGNHQVTEWTTKEFEDNFNASLEHTNLLWLDEFRVSDARSDAVMSRLKNLITEHTLPIRAMRTDTVMRKNWVNVIIATNYPDPVNLVANDRRFNVAPAQETPIRVSTDEIIALDDEVWLFASYLFHRQADFQKARTVIKNDARAQMIDASQATHEAFFTAVRVGNLDYFLNFLRVDTPADNVFEYQRFQNTVLSWVRDTVEDPETEVKIERDVLREIFRYITGIPTTPAKFSRMCSIHRVQIHPHRFNGIPTRAASIKFTHNDMDELRSLVQQLLQPKKPLKLIRPELEAIE